MARRSDLEEFKSEEELIREEDRLIQEIEKRNRQRERVQARIENIREMRKIIEETFPISEQIVNDNKTTSRASELIKKYKQSENQTIKEESEGEYKFFKQLQIIERNRVVKTIHIGLNIYNENLQHVNYQEELLNMNIDLRDNQMNITNVLYNLPMNMENHQQLMIEENNIEMQILNNDKNQQQEAATLSSVIFPDEQIPSPIIIQDKPKIINIKTIQPPSLASPSIDKQKDLKVILPKINYPLREPKDKKKPGRPKMPDKLKKRQRKDYSNLTDEERIKITKANQPRTAKGTFAPMY